MFQNYVLTLGKYPVKFNGSYLEATLVIRFQVFFPFSYFSIITNRKDDKRHENPFLKSFQTLKLIQRTFDHKTLFLHVYTIMVICSMKIILDLPQREAYLP